MARNASIENKPSGVFKTFPEFSRLTLADRTQYEALIKEYPPTSSSSFYNLMTWWNSLESCAVSVLNGNLVISYWFPGEEKVTGLSILGNNHLDESICTVFDYLRAKGSPVRLVHVSEHVLHQLQYPELFKVKPEHFNDEYVLSVSKYYPLKYSLDFRQYRVRKFQSRHADQTIIVKSVDLNDVSHRRLLLDRAKKWHKTGVLKNFVKQLDDSMAISIEHADLLGTNNLCLFVDGELQAYILFCNTQDRRYVLLSHAIFGTDMPYIFDYAVYAFAQWFTDKGVSYINVDSDLGIPALRMLKLALGPDHYFRHYIIEPAP